MVIEKRGPRSYLIELMTGCVVRQHIDHIRSCTEYSDEVVQENNDDWTDHLSANTEPVTPDHHQLLSTAIHHLDDPLEIDDHPID